MSMRFPTVKYRRESPLPDPVPATQSTSVHHYSLITADTSTEMMQRYGRTPGNCHRNNADKSTAPEHFGYVNVNSETPDNYYRDKSGESTASDNFGYASIDS